MSATERIRAMLDERGVEWGSNDTYRLFVTSWSDASGHSWAFMEHRDGSFSKLTAYHITPEQAIAATLGRSDVGRYVGLRQGEYWERTENSNYYCGGCGWKVTDHDSYCPECGGALHNATPRTCHNVWDIELTGRLRFQCSECGGVSLEIKPNFCPVCGRKVVKPATNYVDAEEDE